MRKIYFEKYCLNISNLAPKRIELKINQDL